VACDENIQVRAKVVISYNPASKLVLFQTGAFLPFSTIRLLSKCVMISFGYHTVFRVVNFKH
jgi:hypothetical protein